MTASIAFNRLSHPGLMLIWMICAACTAGAEEPVPGQQRESKPSATAVASPGQVRYIDTSKCYVYAGPSQEYYPTDVLHRGEAVEVFDFTQDGWVAIRPPQGSFSWLPAAQGLLLPGGRVVEVTDPSAVSWIGTALGSARQYRWQVQLHRGEQLSVLGESTVEDPASSKSLWYKIAPPNGEFRWVEAKCVTDQVPESQPQDDSDRLEEGEDTEADQTADQTRKKPSRSILQGDQAVVLASGQRPLNDADNARPSPAGTARAAAKRPKKTHVVKHGHGSIEGDPDDRWSDWHAVDFKDGSLTFPGIARMFGLQPREIAPQVTKADPFDLAADYARPPSADDSAAQAVDAQSANRREPMLVNDSVPTRQSRGWRDPRALREARIHAGGLSATERSDGLAAATRKDASHDEVSVSDSSASAMARTLDDDDQPVGSSVVTAGATRAMTGEVRPGAPSAANESTWFGVQQASARTSDLTTDVTQASLGDLQLRLSEVVAGPEATWNLAPLSQRARYFVEHGADAVERGQARLLLERIDEFSEVVRRSSALGITQTVGGPVAPAGSGASGLGVSQASWSSPRGPIPADQQVPSQGTGFDATGWLVPVHSDGRDMPTHALTNDAGRIIVYVTAAPGVNLTRYQSEAIGVYGLRGYLPQLKTNHIQVQRVVRLR